MRIRHKGLRALYERDDARHLPPERVERIREILTALDDAVRPGNLDLPGYRLHPLRGNRAGFWSVSVSRNYRIVFQFRDGQAIDVDFVDYH
ncbi:MAG: type II toxin-antitoxin system RelE/ParE family toxin [Rhodospirillaceae bacterium]|nr:type II toxin-antitoxin system RelE/ParE family toxin [Rhodospirillaceae bacterium]MDE0360287.1 type II toxin-antitoxin system RelE/ParE family toxin [Rhodospirillaceae bacterium]